MGRVRLGRSVVITMVIQPTIVWRTFDGTPETLTLRMLTSTADYLVEQNTDNLS